MIQRATPPLSDLYEADETAWLDSMAERIREGQLDALDYAHLQEYLTDMANRDRREVQARLAQILASLLKWEYKARGRTRSSRSQLMQQRYEIEDLLESRVLWKHAESTLPQAYANAVEVAAAETGLQANRFPAVCPYTLEQLVSCDLTAEKAPR